MSMDPMNRCYICGQDIRSSADERWLWHRDTNPLLTAQLGPMHEPCAAETVSESPNHWFRSESDMLMANACANAKYAKSHEDDE